ncbi:MAG: hypothetical protein IJP17_05205 [Clostridia bacterium]|nr:hypothetical protein [Clostridia bacterium]
MSYDCIHAGGQCSDCGECRREREVVLLCDMCGESVYEGDDYYNLCGEIICVDCLALSRRTA